MFKNSNRGISTLLAIGIIAVLVVVVGGGILAYQYYYIPKQEQETKNLITETSKIGTSKIDTTNWKLFTDDKVGYSLKYPPELKTKQTSTNGLKENIARIIIPVASAAGLPPNTWGFKSDFLVFDIYREKLEDMDNEANFHPGYPGLTTKEEILQDEESLKNGQFGSSIGFSEKQSQKVVKIDNSLYGKEFTILRQFEICDVLPTRTFIFFKNGYKVSVTLQAWAVDKIESELPQYFTTNQENCGDSLIWKNSSQFYDDLASGTIDSETEVGIWYNTFDKIISTIDLFEVPLSEASDLEIYRNTEYGFEIKYPQDWKVAKNVLNFEPDLVFCPNILATNPDPEVICKIREGGANTPKPTYEDGMIYLFAYGTNPEPNNSNYHYLGFGGTIPKYYYLFSEGNETEVNQMLSTFRFLK